MELYNFWSVPADHHCLAETLNLPRYPYHYGFGGKYTAEEVAVLQIWEGAFAERFRIFDRWMRNEVARAKRAGDLVIARFSELSVVELLARIAASRGALHMALFGQDEWAARFDGVEMGVDERGASITICIRAWFGGGDRWFGPPGERVHRIQYRLPDALPLPPFPRDDGLAAAMHARDVAHERAWRAEQCASQEARNRRHNATARNRTRAIRNGDEYFRGASFLPDAQCERDLARIARWERKFDRLARYTFAVPTAIQIWPGKARFRQSLSLPILRDGSAFGRLMAA